MHLDFFLRLLSLFWAGYMRVALRSFRLAACLWSAVGVFYETFCWRNVESYRSPNLALFFFQLFMVHHL